MTKNNTEKNLNKKNTTNELFDISSITCSDINAPIAKNKKWVVFLDYALNIPYIGVCSKQITEIAKQDNSFIDTLRTMCCNIILYNPASAFETKYIDDDTNKEIRFIIRHITDSSGIHTFYFYTHAEPGFLPDKLN